MGFRPVAELAPDATTRVFEHGWQSWSPTDWYPLTRRPPRPTAPNHHVMAYRPGVESRNYRAKVCWRSRPATR